MPAPRRGSRAARQLDQRRLRRFELELEGLALTKARPRVTYGHAYTPQRTREWEERVAIAFLQAHGRPLLAGPVAVRIEFNQRRGDLDNLAKAILDGLNGVAWVDDAQVCQLLLSRPWEPRGRARTWIAVEELRG